VGSQEVDLTSAASVDELRRILRPPDAVVMASALTPEHGRDRAAFLKNVRMADHVAAALGEIRCAHLVYISSDSVYDSGCEEVSEESCCETGDMYGLSHIVREKMLADACQSAGTRLAIVRPGAIYGAGDTHNSYGPNRFMRSALRDGKITLFGRGEELRDHVYIDDVTRIVELCLRHGSSGVLNAVSGTAISFADAAREVAAAAGREVTIETQARRVPIVHRRFNGAVLHGSFPEFQATPFAAGARRAMAELTGA
jgi:nucleoside-diphosphate-sugar epimerase